MRRRHLISNTLFCWITITSVISVSLKPRENSHQVERSLSLIDDTFAQCQIMLCNYYSASLVVIRINTAIYSMVHAKCNLWYTVRRRYNAVNCLLWIQNLIFCLSFCNNLCNIFLYWTTFYNSTRLYHSPLVIPCGSFTHSIQGCCTGTGHSFDHTIPCGVMPIRTWK